MTEHDARTWNFRVDIAEPFRLGFNDLLSTVRTSGAGLELRQTPDTPTRARYNLVGCGTVRFTGDTIDTFIVNLR